jgi:tRNA nucleotidyltransferase (CCA-adding enzyme)
MILVTTHEGADFDSAAGVLAALVLHPGAVASFPGAKGSAVKRYLEAHPDLLPEVRARDVDLDSVETLILVDTVAPGRIGRFRELLEPDRRVRLICYDHHPDSPPPEGAEVHSRATGAVASLMVERIRSSGATIDPDSATFLALGIYEDTGGLLYQGTTPEDLLAVAWLLEQGADLNRIGRILARGLSPEQVELYHALLHEARRVRVAGETVVLAAVAVAGFVPEASVVVQQYAQTTHADRLVALIRMGDRIVLIARSRSTSLSAAKLAARFGGGGHASAASAVIRDRTLIEARDEVLEALRDTLVPSVRAGELATPILYTVAADASVNEGVKLLNRYRVNALPIVEGDRVVGALTRQIADMALHHGLAKREVRDLVASELEVLEPEADLDVLRERLLQGNERFVLVGEDPSSIAGIITRTALLGHLHTATESGAAVPRADSHGEDRPPPGEDLSGMLARRLPKGALEILREVGTEHAVRAWLVGGGVRDLLLRRENRDLDVVVEGDACGLARRIGERRGVRVHVHDAFQTAAVFLPGDLRLDLVRARTEHYRGPGALPEVEPGGLRQDLFRRDFTINTLAIRLTPPGFGRLVDHFGGRRDLTAGKIRALHGLSFIEDPTRPFRAIRFAARLGFEISRETSRLIQVARREAVFDSLSPQRLRRELELILDEKRVVRAVEMLASFKLLSVVHPALRPTRTTYTRLERAEEVLGWYRLLYEGEAARGWIVALGVLVERLDAAQREEILARLRPGRLAARVLTEAPDVIHRLISRLARRRSPAASRVHELCREQPTEVLLLAMALTGREEVRRSVALYLSRLRDVRADIGGADLVRAGVPEGPRVAAGLAAALRAKLDGEAPDREDQMRKALAAARPA